MLCQSGSLRPSLSSVREQLGRRAQDRDDALRRPGRLDPACDSARSGGPARPARALLRRRAIGARAARRDRREVHRRRRDGRLRSAVAHGDDPDRAIAAALAVIDRVSAIDGDLAVRVGIETGEVLAVPESGDLRVTGEAVNAAARLQQAASPGEVLVGERTARACRRAQLERNGHVDAKGIDNPLTRLPGGLDLRRGGDHRRPADRPAGRPRDASPDRPPGRPRAGSAVGDGLRRRRHRQDPARGRALRGAASRGVADRGRAAARRTDTASPSGRSARSCTMRRGCRPRRGPTRWSRRCRCC